MLDLISYTTKMMRPNLRTEQIMEEFRLYPRDLMRSKDAHNLRPDMITMVWKKYTELNMKQIKRGL